MVEAGAPRTRVDRALRAGIFALFPYPRRMRMLRGPLKLTRWRGVATVAGRLHPSLGAMAALTPPIQPRVELPRRIAALPGGRPGPARARVGLLTGCVQSAFFSHVSAATARVLSREGCDVVVQARPGCCGALAHHAGRTQQARRMARRTVAAFDRAGVDAVVTDVAGCGSVMKEYGDLLADDPRWATRAATMATKVRDITELLVALGEPLSPRHPVPLTVAYHDACHLSHGQGVRTQPRHLLAGIPDLRVVPVPDADVCCGSAGVYNLLEPDAAARLGSRKVAALRSAGADAVVAGNPGCLLQIAAAARREGESLRVMHTVEVLDASLCGTPLPE
jgi:glycolate oxidase iron-sulfur subunit